jgi:hypothetical protein
MGKTPEASEVVNSERDEDDSLVVEAGNAIEFGANASEMGPGYMMS